MTDDAGLAALQYLARACGIETEYRDNTGHRQEASAESLLAVLQAFGVPVDGPAGVADARRERRRAYWRRALEPVIVAWDGVCPEIDLRLPSDAAFPAVHCEVVPEEGEVQRWTVPLDQLRAVQEAQVDGEAYRASGLRCRQPLPPGYHRLRVEVGRESAESLIISAPAAAYSPFTDESRGVWGAFLPLYALASKRSWGAGDFSDLEAFMEWVSRLGGSVVGTLPFLASFLDSPCDPSPYTPASRLFWNEFYVDVTRVPELEGCPEAQAAAAAAGSGAEVESLRGERLVDYRRVMALKRRVLEILARDLGPEKGERYREFMEAREGVWDYARFRATVERRGETWHSWPERLRDGDLREEDYLPESAHYHAYVQWLADSQLRGMSERARGRGMSLYLDLPLGVHREGYDTWREQGLFVPEVSSGAPPDALFHKGQNWGFPPLHPAKMREQGHRYPIAYLRRHMECADMLRVDHVMGLHHLYWVPQGMDATRGVYVRYPADEMYAILSLESHRHRCAVVGENLGTVPPYVNEAMAQHGVSGLYVVQYEVPTDSGAELAEPPRACVASLNTHDMPPLAAFWRGLEIERWHALGLVTDADANARVEERYVAKRNLVRFLERKGYLQGDREDAGEVLRACLAFLARGPAQVLLLNMEDLWLETDQQNVPGVVEGHPNWQRKARYDFDAFSDMPQVLDLLRSVARAAQP